jgi:hypothetical protein
MTAGARSGCLSVTAARASSSQEMGVDAAAMASDVAGMGW